ncbi:MAG TPA: cupin domain-containing protein [Actinomycetota bacterium]|nr:cupin domain-containing protein [Actinomycetota bacterium]
MVTRRQILMVRADERVEGPATPGMRREQAFATEGMWAGLATTEPETISGWHHHGEYESVIYVLSGALRMESGPGGSSTIDAGPGDFILVPRGVVHREGNPTSAPAEIVVVRAGSGESSFNVDGPDPA